MWVQRPSADALCPFGAAPHPDHKRLLIEGADGAPGWVLVGFARLTDMCRVAAFSL